jgi:hypothetical protein
MKRTYFVCLFLLIIYGEAFAGPFCPEGYRPEGPSFAYDCVSNSTGEILGGGGTGEPSSKGASSPPPIEGHLEPAWGALVWDSKMLIADYKNSLYFGVAMAHRTKQAAIDDAMSQCENDGGKSCQVQATITKACLGLAGAKGKLVWAIQKFNGDVLATSDRAGANALAKCEKLGYEKCEVIYSDCSINNWVTN